MSGARDLLGAEWPPERAGEMLDGLAATAGLAARGPRRPSATPASLPLPEAARAGGLRTEPVTVWARGAWPSVRRMAPLVLEIPGRPGRLAIARAGASHAVLWTPAGRRRVPSAALEDALWAPIDSAAEPHIPAETPHAAVEQTSVAAARLLAVPALEGRPLAEGWLLRSMTTRMLDELRAAKVGRRAAAVVGAYFVQFALFLAIWTAVGGQALASGGSGGGGRFVMRLGTLLGAWVVAQLGASWLLSRLALDVGGVVRAALMRGALRLDRDRIRTAGLGQLLGRTMDAEVLDVLALGGGVELVAAAFELTLGALALGAGCAPVASLAALALVLTALLAAARVQGRRLAAWSRRRRALTHDLVERMVGHRTVLVQDRPLERAQADEAALTGYERDTRRLDRWEAIVSVALPRLWFVLGLAGLAPVLLRATEAWGVTSTGTVALSVGGVWLVYGAFRRLGAALPTLALARDAWREIAPLVGGAEEEVAVKSVADGAVGADEAAATPLFSSADVGYRYPGRSAPALAGVNIAIAAGERVLVEGASGGGKSTLAALLTGLRVPTEGQLRLRGIEQARVGLDRWRRTIAGAPQFHDNHVFSTDLLFNVLMGRRWPPRMEDVQEAERVCREVGLGPLLDRMPAGLQQQVGETGWRLSHGERSRIFVARSLLQQVEARVLDESFAALDPETLDAVLAAVLARPQALIVVAHP